MHDDFRRLRDQSIDSHDRGRAVTGISQRDVTLARLYSYAFRLHVIGAFHATRIALEEIECADELVQLQLLRVQESLLDLANRGMDVVEQDERALISTFHHYWTHVERSIEAFEIACQRCEQARLIQIRDHYVQQMEAITTSNGIYLTVDTQAPPQASFVVPNLGITIVPLVYGDHHSWNLAWLDGQRSDVPYHRHHQGVEIHLGYGPLHGYTVLGDAKAEVTEGYAMPIPPGLRHGYTNLGNLAHHVPFVFGSQVCSGWGVFLDVEPQPQSLERLTTKPLLSRALNHTILLEREIDKAAAKQHPVRYPIIPAAATDRNGIGGLELSISRIDGRGFTLHLDRYCAVSVVRGQGRLRIADQVKMIKHHDHFGIPANVSAEVTASENSPLVLLDTVLKPAVNRN